MALRSRRSRGFALLIVLWTIALAALIATEVTTLGRSETRIAANLRAAATVQAAADGAVYDAIYGIMTNDQAWSDPGMLHTVAIGPILIVVTAADERGKININNASTSLLAALCVQVGIDGETAKRVATAIAAWRGDMNADPALISAWRARYMTAGYGYIPPFAHFQTVDEVTLVFGVTPEIFARLRPHITVYGAGNIMPKSADPVVRAALRANAMSPTTTRTIVPLEAGRIMTIVARATGPNHASFLRRAVVGISKESGTYSIYRWVHGTS
jgi:general secretion pathway protein K